MILLKKKDLKIIFIIALALFFSSYIIEGSFDTITSLLAVVVIVVGYVTGALAYVIHILLLLFGFIVSLPVFSTIYALTLTAIAKIHYFIFGYMLKSVLMGTERYKRIQTRVRNSRVYQMESALFHRFLDRLGIKKPKKVHIFELDECEKCRKEIPITGKYCPECGDALKKKSS